MRAVSDQRAQAPAVAPAVRVGERDLWHAALVVPLVVLLIGAWSRRWTSDDGFINLRIVDQLWAGNGPVWNAVERVETGTSPLWLAVIAVTGGVLRFVEVEWVAAVLGIIGTVGGLGAAILAARTLHGSHHDRFVPLGALVVACLPVFWDFASSGLETGLTFLWLGVSSWALARAASSPALDITARRTVVTAALLGLGPLVRPDLALVSAATLVALLVLTRRRGWRRCVLVVVAAGVLPIGYQVFRMAYFAAIVPNTAFAKEGGTSRWGAGWAYAGDFASTWHLWWPLLLLATAAVVALRVDGSRAQGGDDRRRRRTVTMAITVGAALHALYVVRVGGDFMHGRLLLPAMFALAVPWAAVPVRRSSLLLLAALLPWAVPAMTSWEAPGQPDRTAGPAAGVVDERAYYVAIAGHPNPVTAEDFGEGPYAVGGRLAAAVAAAGRGSLTLRTWAPDDRSAWSPLRDGGAPFSVAVDNIGVYGFLAGPDVTVIDVRGLGDPVTSRFRLAGERGRPGHEKAASSAWIVGRHGAPGTARPAPEVDAAPAAAARAATGCGQLGELLAAISEPLSATRAVRNVRLALRSYGLRFSSDPLRAQDELC